MEGVDLTRALIISSGAGTEAAAPEGMCHAQPGAVPAGATELARAGGGVGGATLDVDAEAFGPPPKRARSAVPAMVPREPPPPPPTEAVRACAHDAPLAAHSRLHGTGTPITIATSSIADDETQCIRFATRELGASLIKNISLVTPLTHLVTSEARCGPNALLHPSSHGAAPPPRGVLVKRTMKYLKAIARGAWVVDVGWVRASREAGYWVDERAYEVSGDNSDPAGGASHAPRLARQAHAAGKPKLLQNWSATFIGTERDFITDKQLINDLLNLMGASTHTRSSGAPTKEAPLGNSRRGSGKARVRAETPRMALAATGAKSICIAEALDEATSAHFGSSSHACVTPQWVIETIGKYEVQPFGPYPSRLIRK